MKILHKVIVVFLLVGMMLSVFSACGDTEKKESKSTKIWAEDSTCGLAPMKNADKPVSFSMFVRDPGQAPAKNNPVIKKITELTGVTIKYEYLVGDLNQKLGVMVASGDYPDILFCEAVKFVDAQALVALEDLIPKYPNLKKHYAPYMNKMIAGFDGKHAYTLENYGIGPKPAPIFRNPSVGFYIQKDVLANSGYKIPKTIDEYFQLIEDYKTKYPTIDGKKTIGFEVLSDGWRDFCLRNPAQHLMGAGNDGGVYVNPKTFVASLYQTSDTAKNYYMKLNEEYKKGIIEAETFTQNYDQYQARISSGAVLGMFDQYWNFQNAENTLKAAGKFERTYVAVPIANPGVKDGYLDLPGSVFSGTGGISITKRCKNVDRLLAFYDWILQPEVQDYLQWGEEGKDWTKVGTNGRKLTDARRELNRDNAKRRDQTGDTIWQMTPKFQGLYEDGTPCGPGDALDEFAAELSEYDKKFLKDLNIQYFAQLLSEPVKRPSYYPTWSFPIEDGSPAKVANTKIEDICRKYYPQLILSKDGQYDKLWDEFINDMKAGNPQPYLDEVNRQIKEKQKVK